MPTIAACILSGLGALILWGVVGFALGRRFLPATLVLPLAPALGWACHSAIAAPVLSYAGLTRATAIAGFAVPVAAAFVSLAFKRGNQEGTARVPFLAYGLAGLLAVVPALAVMPKLDGDAVAFAAPIFDHAKIALIDDIIRSGLPPGNPFFGDQGGPSELAYYYLWHFSAAELGVVFGATGWEADIALTGFTAFASLALMAGLAVWIGNRAGAALLAVPLAFAASLHPVLECLLGAKTFYSIILPPTGLAGWLFQTSWAPQHTAAASSVLLACFLLARLAQAPSLLIALVLAAVVAAGYASSLWIGGVLFGLVAPVLLAALLADCPTAGRKRFAAFAIIAAVFALVLACPLIKAQFIAAGARQVEHPIALATHSVFNIWIPESLRGSLDAIGYWVVFLFIEFPAIYVPGLVSLAHVMRDATQPVAQRTATKAFAALLLVSLSVAGFLTLTFADNNDLGWRSVLPGVFILIIYSAGGLSRWIATPRPFAAAATLILLVLGLPKSIQILTENARGSWAGSGGALAQTQAMWASVRQVARPDERVGNSPLLMAEMTPWPVNLSWALFADRRSCYAGRELALAFAPIPRRRQEEIERRFQRAFDGRPEPVDVRDLAVRHGCRVIVVTPRDGAWNRDPFAASAYYERVEAHDDPAGGWRIYRARGAPSSPNAPG
jgi:hypothetical protein